MRKFFILLAASMLCFVSEASSAILDAERVHIGDLYYNLYDDGTAEVSRNKDLSGEVIIPSSVLVESTTYTVTGIGEHAFGRCESLTSVTIPTNVTSIGDYAFAYCRSLTSITIPNSVTSIGDYAFEFCDSLTSVTIPNSVTSIGNYAFLGSGITEPVYNAHIFAYLPESYSGHYSIPQGIEQISGGAFEYCKSLTSVTIPNGVTSIGNLAFFFCKSLTSITIPNSVTSIGNRAFFYSGITEPVYNAHIFAYLPQSYSGHYSIPQGIEQIAGAAFENCKSLTSVTIPNSVTSIGDVAFQGCESLTSVTIPNGVPNIGNGAFRGCESLSSVTIPNSVTSIGDWAFVECKRLTSVTIPNSVTSIGYEAFDDCESLTSVTIPNSVTSLTTIRVWAFEGCSPNLQIKYEE